ncbi:MAG TPA: alkaline phosphatase D family protein [Casimicrobiaceae bacterium]
MRSRLASSVVAVLLLVFDAAAVDAHLVVMHGYADYTSALLWVQAEAPGPIRIRWRGEHDGVDHETTLDARAASDDIVLARLTGLAPGARAAYTVDGDGERREGAVRAQPYWTRGEDAPDITIAIGSCFFLAAAEQPWGESTYGGGYEIFDAIAAKAPDLMVWLGDNLYFQPPDELDPASMAARYRRQRALPALQRLLTAAPQVAIWDDHDYGPNDADMSYVLKGEALALFTRYWANPGYGLPDAPGIFGQARLGDVDLFLLDDRWYRSANRMLDAPGKTMFGAQQLAWLRNALVHSHAPLKLVVNGSQMWNRVNRFEGLNHYSYEQKAFADWLLVQRVDGVIFASGDRHFSELLRIDRPGAYPLYEFTSSPLTSRPWEKPEAAERTNADVVPGTLVGKRQFGLIRLTGPAKTRRIALESYDQKGVLLWRYELRAQDLRFRRR